MTSKTDISLSELAQSVRHLKASAVNKNRAMFDDNANYLRGLIEGLIAQQSRIFESPEVPLYAVTLHSKITGTDATFDVRAKSDKDALRFLINRGFLMKNHIVRNVERISPMPN
jgi:hypothetical protein